MARFDVHRNPGASTATVPFLLNVQSPLLDDVATRIVIPLRKADALGNVPAPSLLMPRFVIDGIACVLDTPQMAAIPSPALGAAVANLESGHGVIVAALDFLFKGF
jgi:toxin CcdB